DWLAVGNRKSQIGRGKHSSNRHATQPINAMLNYGYAVLAGRVKLSIASVGLDPKTGFLHSEQLPTTAE
ncbi:MAG TPA: CRISPR-associated endonuclease Cas1, partial [Candidatus Binataceae bacterium]|nr:CRISPR-associated endonuclease Cas1 [Candidatus Binataceae bacterium]